MRTHMVDVYVAAGSNREPKRYLARALELLALQFKPMRVSPAYRNRAVGFEGEDFINLVVGFSTVLPFAGVRERLQQIEAACDRQPNDPKWAPRTMDLDVLLYGDLICKDPGFIVPRPDLLKRAYMLKPLFDIAPDVEHPTERKTIAQLWQEFDQGAHELVVMTAFGKKT
jgi:2-amino-4-hydroxy-6-hydroxymethyldihydropteridine diphosphokinase